MKSEREKRAKGKGAGMEREIQRRPFGTIDKSKIIITRDGSNDNEDEGCEDHEVDVTVVRE